MSGHLDVGDAPRPLSKDYLTQHNIEHGKPSAPLECIVVRIEVSDTGCGIKPQDMIQSKLFSAFNQTEQGRQQGLRVPITCFSLSLKIFCVKVAKEPD